MEREGDDADLIAYVFGLVRLYRLARAHLGLARFGLFVSGAAPWCRAFNFIVPEGTSGRATIDSWYWYGENEGPAPGYCGNRTPKGER